MSTTEGTNKPIKEGDYGYNKKADADFQAAVDQHVLTHNISGHMSPGLMAVTTDAMLTDDLKVPIFFTPDYLNAIPPATMEELFNLQLAKHGQTTESFFRAVGIDPHTQEVGEGLLKADKTRAIAAMREFLLAMGFDVDNEPHMKGTPERVYKLYRNELFRGMYEKAPNITTFESANGEKFYDQMIFSGNLTVRSTCSHHMLPISGTAHIGLILDENSNLPGLSKYARILHHYASMPQVQERLTDQVAAHLMEEINPRGVGVMIVARHFCMCHRGVHEKDSDMVTTALLGCFRDVPSIHAEFLQTIAISTQRS